MSLVDLPAELFHHICESSAKNEIQNLRLVSKHTSQIADEYLLPVLELYYAQESLAFATEVASRPRIARSVRFVCFHADRLNGQGHRRTVETQDEGYDNQFSFEDWAREWDQKNWIYNRWAGSCTVLPRAFLRGMKQITRPETYSDTLRRNLLAASRLLRSNGVPSKVAYANYLCKLDEQSSIDNNDSIRLAFATLFQTCQNLNEIVVTTGDSLAPTTTWRLRSFREALAFPHSDPQSLQSGVHALTSIIRAALDAQRSIRFLGAGRLSHNFFMQSPSVMVQLAEVFRDIKKFIIQLETPFEFGLRNDDEQQMFDLLKGSGVRKIPEFLSTAQLLEDLTVILPGTVGRLPLGCIVGTNFWPFLHKLRLDWFETTDKDLENFLLRHNRLEHLHIADMDVTKGCLSRLLRRLAGEFQVLHHVRLRGILQDVDCSERCRWALTGAEWCEGRSTLATLHLETYFRTGLGPLPVQKENHNWPRPEECEDEIEPYLRSLVF